MLSIEAELVLTILVKSSRRTEIAINCHQLLFFCLVTFSTMEIEICLYVVKTFIQITIVSNCYKLKILCLKFYNFTVLLRIWESCIFYDRNSRGKNYIFLSLSAMTLQLWNCSQDFRKIFINITTFSLVWSGHPVTVYLGSFKVVQFVDQISTFPTKLTFLYKSHYH